MTLTNNNIFNHLFFVFACFCIVSSAFAKQPELSLITQAIEENAPLSGVVILDKGQQALIARAWLADNAQKTIDVQYFIWSDDNIGILTSEALLRAAERGVIVRVIVDDLLIDAPNEILIALALHPNIHIKIYNPKHSVGTPWYQRIFNIFSDLKGVNQRMHDKTFIVDDQVAITGGRNMADEYFDFNQTYNFRDRDALVLGTVVKKISHNFESFWLSPLSQNVQQRFSNDDLNKISNSVIQKNYQELHDYAQLDENFTPNIRQAINNISLNIKPLLNSVTWANIRFIHDTPGKNNAKNALDGGGISGIELAKLLEKAQHKVIIQSPYLILTDEAQQLFSSLIKRGVKVIISTNSLAATDNLQAFSGYKNQRDDLIAMGIQSFEYKPNPLIQKDIMQRYDAKQKSPPIFALHAKTMVIDSQYSFIGTFNLDPRSQNLNTEVGVIINDKQIAQWVEQKIELDIGTENSWSASENPDQYASWIKRLKVNFWQLMPIKALL